MNKTKSRKCKPIPPENVVVRVLERDGGSSKPCVLGVVVEGRYTGIICVVIDAPRGSVPAGEKMNVQIRSERDGDPNCRLFFGFRADGIAGEPAAPVGALAAAEQAAIPLDALPGDEMRCNGVRQEATLLHGQVYVYSSENPPRSDIIIWRKAWPGPRTLDTVYGPIHGTELMRELCATGMDIMVIRVPDGTDRTDLEIVRR